MPEPFDEEDRPQDIFNSFAAAIAEVCNWIDPTLGNHVSTIVFIVRGAVSAVTFVRKKMKGDSGKSRVRANPKRPAPRKRSIKDTADRLDREM